ncbi:MAG: restriction endonuclease [Chloroflexota bacterium]
MDSPTPITLTEYQSRSFSPTEISSDEAERLDRYYRQQIVVEPPWAKTNYRWQLTAQGWVGYIPLTSHFHLALQPKVPLSNLFQMLEYAYRLNIELLEGAAYAQSLPEFYERLAHILAQRVLDRARQGFYRTYVSLTDRLPYVRGRLNVQRAVQQPLQIKPECDYQEHTADIDDNRILLFTLWRLVHSGVCTERVLPTIRQAYRSLQGLVLLQPCSPEACLGRQYHRLNQDYQPMHILCRFILAQTGPSHHLGSRQMLPFLINMARLYEMFVAEWLRAHCPGHLRLRVQETVANREVGAVIDLVLADAETGVARCVLDTKYKTPDKQPSKQDIHQVVAYAEIKHCREAVLIYPAPLPRPLDTLWGNIRVRSLTFALTGSLDEAGQAFLQDLGLP